MAVTRIKNNQITDATINAAAKVSSYSITSGLLANNLNYGSDLTITGNLLVTGNTTTINTVDLIVEDPIIILASTQTGSPAVDIGYIGKRGTSTNVAFVWKENATEFETVYTNSVSTNTTITVSAFADLKSANITANTNLAVVGTTSLTGNVIGTNTNFTGNITVGNLINNGSTSLTGNVTGGNLLTGGVVSATGNITGGNLNTGAQVVATGNITGGNLLTGGLVQGATVSATGNIVGGNANITSAVNSATVSASGNITGGNLNTGAQVVATGNITGGNILTAGIMSSTGNATHGNVIIGGLLTATGNVNTTAGVLATGNVTGGNLTTGAQVVATGNITGGNLITAGLITATGNINTSGTVNTAAVKNNSGALTISTGSGNINITPAANIVLSNTYINSVAYPVQDQDAASKLYVDNMASTQLAYHESVAAATTTTLESTTGGTITYNQPGGAGNGIGATLTVSGGTFNLIDTANVQTANTRILVKDQANAALNGIYIWSNATVITRSSDADTYGPNSITDLSINDYFFVTSGNVNKGSAWICDGPSGTITFGTSNINFAQFSSSQTYTANTSAGIVINGTVISAKVDNNTTAFDGSGNIIVKAGANLTTPNIGAATGTSLSTTGTVTAGNLATSGTASATGNVNGGNLISAALVQGVTLSATGNIVGGNANITSAVNSATVSATGNITGGNLATGGTASATGNITGGNLVTGGLLTATGNVNTSAGVLATGNVTGGNVNTAGLITATGNITGGNLITGGLVSATGAITSGSTISATGNITGGNITTGGQANLGNIRISGDNITDTNGRVNFNTALGAVDFAVNGGAANVFYISAASNTASFGNSTQVTNALTAFNSTTSIVVPVGTTAQRPGTGYTGMVRFNTSINNLEFYDANSWQTAGTTFTVITANTQTGNGVQTAFTLPANATTAGTIVAINGVVQIPTTAYSISGTTCTFTEAPASTDVIDFRLLATTSTITGLASISGAVVQLDPTLINIDTTGNIIPTANITYNLGNSTNRWKDLYLSGSSLTLGNVVMKNVAGGNTVGFYGPDGTTPATIASTSVDTTTISNGTSSVAVIASGGNIRGNVAGATVFTVSSTGIDITGNLSVSGNASLSGNILGDRVQNGTTSFDIQTQNGNANITVGGTSNVVVYSTSGQFTTGVNSASGNVTGGNLITGGLLTATGNVNTSAGVLATGNITGGNLVTGGLLTATGNITGGNLSVGTGTITGGNIVNANANGVGNIGSASVYFNTVFAKATSAQYADLAEKYIADAEYAPGTVLAFGGNKEVTLSVEAGSTRVAGVVSTNPSYIMNAGLTADHVAMVALQGRVPCQVVGLVSKGDLMVAAGNGAAKADNTARAGTIIGKALEDFNGAKGVIEIVVGRN